MPSAKSRGHSLFVVEQKTRNKGVSYYCRGKNISASRGDNYRKLKNYKERVVICGLSHQSSQGASCST